MYNLSQISIFVLFLILGILRLQDANFSLLIFINSSSIVVSILFTLFTAIDKIKRRKHINKKQSDRIQKLQLSTFVVAVVGVVTLPYLCYHDLVSSSVADFLSITAFGMSCANDFLSNALIYNVCKKTI